MTNTMPKCGCGNPLLFSSRNTGDGKKCGPCRRGESPTPDETMHEDLDSETSNHLRLVLEIFDEDFKGLSIP